MAEKNQIRAFVLRAPQSNPEKVQSAQVPAGKIDLPRHTHIEVQESRWPIRTILPAESRAVYIKVHLFSQWMAAATFLAVLILVISLAIFAALFANAAQISPWLSGLLVLFLAAPWLASLALGAWFIIDTYRFSLQDEFLFARSGVINPTYHVVPYENIQDAQVAQGFFERIFGIASVVVSTPASTVMLYAFDLADARKFREELLTLANLHRNMAE